MKQLFTLLCAGLFMGSTAYAASHEVTPKTRTVPKNDVIDSSSLEIVAPDAFAAAANNQIKLFTKTYTPPAGCVFTPYPSDPVTHVDVFMAPISAPVVRLPDTPTAIRVSAFVDDARADDFPLQTEGNMRCRVNRSSIAGTGGGGRTTQTPIEANNHWSAKVGLNTCEDIRDYSRGNDDNIECQYQTAAHKVKIVVTSVPGRSPAIVGITYNTTLDGRPGATGSRDFAIRSILEENGTANTFDMQLTSGGANGDPGDVLNGTLQLDQTVPHDGAVHSGTVNVRLPGAFIYQRINWRARVAASGAIELCEVRLEQIPGRAMPLTNGAGHVTVSLQDLTAGEKPYPAFPGESRYINPEANATWIAGTRCLATVADVVAFAADNGGTFPDPAAVLQQLGGFGVIGVNGAGLPTFNSPSVEIPAANVVGEVGPR